MTRRRKLTDEQIAGLLKTELTHSLGWESDELTADREQAIKYYYGKPRGDEVTGRSQVVSTDLADMVEAVLAEIMPGVENDDLCAFIPQGQDDTDQAALETDAVNAMIMQSNDGYMLFNSAFQNALLFENGYIKVWIDEREEQRTVEFEGIEPEAVPQLIDTDDPNISIEVVSEGRNADDETSIDLTLRVTVTDRALRVTCSDVTNVYPASDYYSIDLADIPFMAERDFPTRSDLIREGYAKKIVNALPAAAQDHKTDSQALRRDDRAANMESMDPSQERLERFICYSQMDIDGTGVAELWEIVLVGGEVLDKRRMEFMPYATGSAWPQPNQLRGLSLYNRLKQVQDVKTKNLRNWLDNQEACNWGRVAARDTVDLDQLTNPRAGGVVICDDPQTDLMAIPTADISGSTLTLMEYADKMRSERGGASLDLQAAEAQIAGDTAHGVERQYSAREKMAGRMSRNLAQTMIKQTFLLVHRAMRTWLRGEFTFRRGGEFVSVDPSTWQPRDDVQVKSGMTLAERNQELQALQQVYIEQKQLIQAGYSGIITDETRAYNALMDMSRAAGVDDPYRYWIDPGSEQAQQAAQQKAQQAQQQQQLDQQLLAMQKQIEDNKNAVDVYQAKLKALIDLLGIRADIEQTEGKLAADAALQIVNMQRGPEGNDGRRTGETGAG